MRRRSGATGLGRRFTGAALAVLVVVSGVVVGIAGPARLGPVGPAPAAAQSAGTSITTTVFSSLAHGAGSEVGGAAAGWAMGAMGLSTDSATLASIDADLKTIISQLNEIEQELAQLNASIQQLDCDTLTANINQARTVIDSLAATYQEFIDQAAGTFGPASVPPLGTMVAWAETVTDFTKGVFPALTEMSNALLPAGSAQGIIKACLQPGVIPPPAAMTVGDTDYYDQVANLVGFYYNYQTRGLLLLQEAYHFQAQQAVGQTLPPGQVGEVCTAATDPTAQFACTSAIEDTNTVYERLAAQFELAGLPYTDDAVLLRNSGKPSAPLFVRSLEKFTQAAGDACLFPLTAVNPCGPTVADSKTVNIAMTVKYAGYTTWTAASKGNLDDLIGSRGSNTPGVYMNSIGFENATNKIILFPQTVSFDVRGTTLEDGTEGNLRGTLNCFLHTNIRSYCSNDDVNDHLLEEYKGSGNSPCRTNQYRTKSGLPTNVNGFLTADTHNKVVNVFDCEWKWTTAPGWLWGNTAASTFQYRWPKIEVSTLKCTNGRSPTNPGGVPTRCGADFDIKLNPILPRPVTCGGTTVGECTSNGYYVATADGGLYAFGDAQHVLRLLDARATHDPARGVTASRLVADVMGAGTQVSDIEVTADGRGLWVLLTDGRILNLGTAAAAPGVAAAQLTDAVAAQAEQVIGLATTRERDLWVFTSAGRIVPQFGALPAAVEADMNAILALDLLGPVIAAEPTADGTGMYAQASDGGVFTYGAPFHGSVYDAIAQARGVPVGSIGPDLPVVGLTVDPDGEGYWVVAADGGVFSLRAPFRGSLPALVPYDQLAAPVNGMVPYGNGYVLVADDGGVFVFSNLPFTGSLAGLAGSGVVDIAAA